MSELPTLVLRADATSRMGSGHVMRTLAVAQAWKSRGGDAVLLSASLPGPLRERLERDRIEVQEIRERPGSPRDAREAARRAAALGASWVVLDGYHFDDEFQRTLKERSALKIFALDDYGHASHRCADVVLNQNSYASEELYRTNERRSRLLLGSQYALLRREFWAWREERAPSRSTVRRLLLSMGGTDAADATSVVLPALVEACPPEGEVRVVVGGSSLFRADDMTARWDRRSPRVRFDRDVQDMAEVLRTSDLAVAAAGITAWELAFMGVPSLLITAAQNQRPVAAALQAVNVARDLGPVARLGLDRVVGELRRLIENDALRDDMRSRGQRLIDGYGTERALAVLSEAGLWLRPAQLDDRELLWRWTNDPVTRKNSFSGDPTIPWETHVGWFEERVLSGRALCFIAFTPEGRAVGQARFDDTPSGATISVSIDPQARGRGYGTRLIRESVRLATERRQYERVTAYIKDDNSASLRAFVRAGFHSPTPCSVRGSRALALRLDKGDTRAASGT